MSRLASALLAALPVVALLAVWASTKSDTNPPTVEGRVLVPDTVLTPEAIERVAPTRIDSSASHAKAALPPPARSPVPPHWDPAEEERQFKWLRETTPPAELERELDALAETLHQQCATELRSRVSAGEFERVHADPEGRYPLPPPRRGVVEFLSGGPDRGLVRVQVPETSVPAAYETQRQIDWLRDLLED